MRNITLLAVERISVKMAQELLPFDEPIPDFSTRRPNILESCLATPFQTYGGKFLYLTLLSRASVLFYLMIKNHPFINGNKRIAVTTLFSFLFANKKWLIVEHQKLLSLAKLVAKSDAKLKNEIVKLIEKFLKLYLADIPE